MEVFVDCEGDPNFRLPPVPPLSHMSEFGAVINPGTWFHGRDDGKTTFIHFAEWLRDNCKGQSPVFWSDNVAYDWKWIDYGFNLWMPPTYNDDRKLISGGNPFGHSGRRISDFYAGLTGDVRNTQRWKHLRVTKHDHNPVHDAMGNYEAYHRMLAGER